MGLKKTPFISEKDLLELTKCWINSNLNKMSPEKYELLLNSIDYSTFDDLSVAVQILEEIDDTNHNVKFFIYSLMKKHLQNKNSKIV